MEKTVGGDFCCLVALFVSALLFTFKAVYLLNRCFFMGALRTSNLGIPHHSPRSPSVFANSTAFISYLDQVRYLNHPPWSFATKQFVFS